MISDKKKVAIFIDSRKKSGGAYHEFLYTLRNIKKGNKQNIKFVIIATSKNLDLELEKRTLKHIIFL